MEDSDVNRFQTGSLAAHFPGTQPPEIRVGFVMAGLPRGLRELSQGPY